MRRIGVVFLFGLAVGLSQVASPAPFVRTEGYVSTDDGTRLYYVEKGSGPNVLIAPIALYLEPHLLEDLAKSRRVIFYDPRNRGRSDAADLTSVSLDRQIQDLESLRQEMHIEKMALPGWSGLGMEMAVYTLRHPDRVTRLIQMSEPPRIFRRLVSLSQAAMADPSSC